MKCLSLILQRMTRYREVREPLSCYCVLTYARCFSGGARHRLDPEIVFFGTDASVATAHAYFYELRNKHIANSINYYEEGYVAIGANNDGAALSVSSGVNFFGYFDEERLNILQRLTKHTAKFVGERTEELWASINANIQAMNSEAVLSLPKLVFNLDRPPATVIKKRNRAKS